MSEPILIILTGGSVGVPPASLLGGIWHKENPPEVMKNTFVAVAAVTCDSLAHGQVKLPVNMCAAAEAVLLCQTYPRDKDDNVKVSLRYKPPPSLPRPLLLAPILPPAGATRGCHGII